jgi:hypothetical protein
MSNIMSNYEKKIVEWTKIFLCDGYLTRKGQNESND